MSRNPMAAGAALLSAVLCAGVAAAEAPRLSMPACMASGVPAGQRHCVSVLLDPAGGAIASMTVTVDYDTAALRLLQGFADVEPGTTLTGGQSVSAFVTEDLQKQAGRVKVLVVAPFQIPAPAIAAGEVARLCFTPPAGAAPGCAALQFVYSTGLEIDFGDPDGNDVPVDPSRLVGGGVLVAGDVGSTTTTSSPPTTTTTSSPPTTVTTTTAVSGSSTTTSPGATSTTVTTSTGVAASSTTTTLPACDRLACRLERLAAELALRDDLGSLRDFVAGRVEAAAAKVSAAETDTRHRRRLLRSAARLLKRVESRVTGRPGRRVLDPAVRGELAGLLQPLRLALSAVI